MDGQFVWMKQETVDAPGEVLDPVAQEDSEEEDLAGVGEVTRELDTSCLRFNGHVLCLQHQASPCVGQCCPYVVLGGGGGGGYNGDRSYGDRSYGERSFHSEGRFSGNQYRNSGGGGGGGGGYSSYRDNR